MMAFLPLLFLAAATRVDLVNEVYRIPPAEWRYVELGLRQQPGLVSARFNGTAGTGEVRLALMRRDDLERLRNGLPHGIIAVTPTGASGALTYYVAGAGDYVLVIDNLGNAPASVHLRISLDFAGRGTTVTRLTAERQLAVIAISFAVFFAIVTFSARRLLRSIKR